MEEQFEMKEWMKSIPESEFRNYVKSGHRRPLTMGKNPALVVIDVTIGFVGSKPQPLEEALKEYSSACGDAFWKDVPQYQRLIALFREKKYPVIFTRADRYNQQFAGKATKAVRQIDPNDPYFNEFPAAVSPLKEEWVLDKTKASMFFDTSLNSYLVKHQIDTVVVCGGSTSGCLRASVVDSCSHGYTTFVVEDCCFDRSYFAHCANLFDMDAKYASVLSLDELEQKMVSIDQDVPSLS
ncbi:isochorismatase family protein [Paenibacillus abyssi]|uniref:Hydrolase n=1 Tax=Paenibacillus abyssi TaxID=1340531 RepID=A0A917CKS4_9BACL|nr:isochorismatase family protein [Paenibacillus abyssi]GGF90994.1 hydrolase [Paenibacillus abyssi]